MPRIETYKDVSGEFRCRVIDHEGHIRLVNGDGFHSPDEAEKDLLEGYRALSEAILERAIQTGSPFTRVGGAAEKPNGK